MPTPLAYSFSELRLELFPSRSDYYTSCPQGIGKDMVACLRALRNLTELHVSMANDTWLSSSLGQALKRSPVRFPDIKKLRMSGVHNGGHLIRACPSVRHLSILCELDRDWKSALREIRHMRGLTCVELTNLRGWKPALLIGEGRNDNVFSGCAEC